MGTGTLQLIQSIGVGGVFALIVIKVVFEFLEKKKNGKNGDPVYQFEMKAIFKDCARSLEDIAESLKSLRTNR